MYISDCTIMSWIVRHIQKLLQRSSLQRSRTNIFSDVDKVQGMLTHCPPIIGHISKQSFFNNLFSSSSKQICCFWYQSCVQIQLTACTFCLYKSSAPVHLPPKHLVLTARRKSSKRYLQARTSWWFWFTCIHIITETKSKHFNWRI